MSELTHINQLCEITDPYVTGTRTDRLFVSAMQEIVSWHAQKSEFYEKLLNLKSFAPDDIKDVSDLGKIPLIPADYFKMQELLSVDQSQIAASFTSSGTSGQKSQMFFDQRSLQAGQAMVDSLFAYFKWIAPKQPTNYLLYSYETESESKVGTAYTDNFLCKYAPIHTGFAAIRLMSSGGASGEGPNHEFDIFGCLEKLVSYAEQGLPVRIFGFPAFLYFTLKRRRALNLPKLQLHPSSLVILGGGWKGHAGLAVSKEELYELVHDQLAIPSERIRDSFGAVEHGVPYMECENHAFHVPVWSRAFIRDVRTLEIKSFGEAGFLQFLTPFNTAVPTHSLMMGDLAKLYPGQRCGCGIKTPFFEIQGRAGTSKNRSCALAASELLGRLS